jgi:hypothetical protein
MLAVRQSWSFPGICFPELSAYWSLTRVVSVAQLGEAFEDDDTVVIAKMDATANDVPDKRFEVKGFPTLVFVKADGTLLPFSGDRKLDAMTDFIKVSHARNPFLSWRLPLFPKYQESWFDCCVFLLLHCPCNPLRMMMLFPGGSFTPYLAKWFNHDYALYT